MFDGLESRRHLSVVLNDLKQIEIVGSDAADVVEVRRRGASIVVTENGTAHAFHRNGVTFTLARTGGGDDRVTFASRLGSRAYVEAGDGNDLVIGPADGMSAYGGAGDDRLFGAGDNDWLTGMEGDDLLVGGGGDDALSGDEGADRVFGGAGNDGAGGGAGDDVVSGGAGNDAVSGDEGRDSLFAGGGNDTLDGGAGDDALDAGAGNDVLSDAEGALRLRGGRGVDVARVLPGADQSAGRLSDVEATEYLQPPADVPPGDAVPPAAASAEVRTSPEHIAFATVTVTLPAGDYEVVWGNPGRSGLYGAPVEVITLEVSLRPVAAGTGTGTATASRTFELGTLSGGPHDLQVTSGGRTLVTSGFVVGKRDVPFETWLPAGINADITDLAVTPSTDRGLAADVTVTWGSTGIRVNYGPLTRIGNEFFVDAAAEWWTGGASAAMWPVRAHYELGALPPGQYAFTLRARTGVVETKYFTVG